MLRIARELEKRGHHVTSRWLAGKSRGATRADNAAYSLTDILIADCLVLFAEGPAMPGGQRADGCGQHVEFGVGLRAGKRLVVVGRRENVFQYVPSVEQFQTIERLLAGLR